MSLPRNKIHATLSQLVCADCGAPDPTWASLNRGVLICGECCSVHRSLGRHVSQIRSLKRGAWHSSQLALIHTLYNNGANNIWEHLLLDPQGGSKSRRKPGPRDPVYPSKADFVRAKYANLSFALRPNKDEGPLNLNDLNRQLWSCVRTSHVETTLRLLALGANPNYFDGEKGTSPLHVAGKEGQSLQVELLTIYGADPAQPDFSGQTAADVARLEGHGDLAERLTDLQFETTDRLTVYLCGRKPDRGSGQQFLIPEMASEVGAVSTGKDAKRRLHTLPAPSFEKLVQDLYDEVDRRETDAAWLMAMGQQDAALINERYIVPFLPVNPEFTSTRNQSRQKLAKFNAREFASLIIDVLSEAKRRHGGPAAMENGNGSWSKHDGRSKTPAGSRSENGDGGPDYDTVAAGTAADENGRMANGGGGGGSPETNGRDTVGGGEGQRTSSKCSKERGHQSGDDTSLVTLEDYLELKDQLANSETKVKELTDSSSEVLKQLRALQETVTRLMQENVELRKDVINIQSFSSTPRENGTPGATPTTTTTNIPVSVSKPEDGSWLKTSKPQPAVRNQRTAPYPVDYDSASETTTTRKSEPKRHFSGDRQLGNGGGGGARSMETSRKVLSTSVSSSSSSVNGGGAGEEGGRGMTTSSSFPNNIVMKTEELTTSIQRLLTDAQAGRCPTFAGHAAKIQEVIDRMVVMVPVSYRSGRIERCLNAMVESCINLTVQCSKDSTEQQEQLACQVVQSAFDVAKAAKLLMNLIQE